MKKLAAFILSIVYLAATVAGMGHIPDKASYAHVVSNISGAKAQLEYHSSYAKDHSSDSYNINCQLKKTAKHLSGKVKAPRPVGFQSQFTPGIPPAHYNANGAVYYYAPVAANPPALYIQHCVFIL